MKPGEVYYTDKSDNYVTAQASRIGIKVKTDKVLIIENYGRDPVIKKMVKVTVL
jgi:hypothetical protein